MSPSERQIEEREARKQRILKGALEVFKLNGLGGASMDQIAQQSGFGKATLYYYFKSKEDADKSIEDYSSNAPSEFPEAEQLLQIRASDTTVMAISLYADNDAMERASAARSKRMSANESVFEVVDTKTGTVTLNHKN